MTWIAAKDAQRTYDPAMGLELVFLSGGSDGSNALEIRGEQLCLGFRASLVDNPMSAAERDEKGVTDDACVWRVYGSWTTSQQSIIADSLSATKMGHGCTLRGESYFVRFTSEGELFGG